MKRSRVEVVVNARSGAADTAEAVAGLQARFAAGGTVASIRVASDGAALRAHARQAALSGCEVVVACGGDGTVSAVAAEAIAHDRVLGVVPLGTFNYFARGLQIPSSVADAVDVVLAGDAAPRDVGALDDHLFLNSASIGLYPSVLRQRRATYETMGRSRFAGYLAVALVLLRPLRVLDIQVTADGAWARRRTPLLFLGLNAPQLDSFAIEGGGCVEAHRMALYVARPLSRGHLLRLAVRAAWRGLRGAPEFEVICAREVRVDVGGARVPVALDGEIVPARSPLTFQLRRGALQVLVPPAPRGA